MTYVLSETALAKLKQEADKTGFFQKTFKEILTRLDDPNFFLYEERVSIERYAENQQMDDVRQLYTEKVRIKKNFELAGKRVRENMGFCLLVMANVLAFMFCTGPVVLFLPILSLVGAVVYTHGKKLWMSLSVLYGMCLIFYKAFGWKSFYDTLLYPLSKGVFDFVFNFCMAPFTDMFEYAGQSIASAYSAVTQYVGKSTEKAEPQPKGDHAANSSNATAPRECSPSPGFACDFTDFLDSMGGFRGLAMMFGLVTKVMLAVNGTFVFVNGSDNTSATILSSHAPIPTVVDQQRFHHNLFLKERNQALHPTDLYSKFEVQAKAMVEKAIEEERKKIATMIAAAIEEDRKMKLAEEEQQRAKKSNDWFFPALTSVGMAVGYGVVWEISKQACLKAVRLIGGNPRFQPFVRAAHVVMSVVPLVYTQDAEALAGGGMLAVGTQVFSGVGVSTLAFQVLGYVGKMIYEYALTPVEARIITAEDLARNAPAEAGNPMNPPGAAALSRAANGGGSNVHTITTTK